MDAVMLHGIVRGLLFIFLVAGCTSPSKRLSSTPAPKARGTSAPLRPLVIPENRPSPLRLPDGDDPAMLIPPPPNLSALERERTLPLSPIPTAPQTESDLVPISIRNPQPFPENSVKIIHDRAVEQYAKMDAFEARLTRHEVVNNRPQPKEILHFQFRKKPLSVHMRWIGTEGQGREVIFVSGKYDNKLQILPARGDTAPLPPFKMALAPDDPTILSKSRHDIRQAGFAQAITHLGEMLRRIDANPAESSRLRSLGSVQRPEFSTPMDGIEETIPPNEDRGFPKGGRRLYYFDATPNAPSFGLPVLVIAFDEKNREVEYYCFDRFMHPVQLDDADFDVSRMGARR
jgi:hypothetical protein